MRLPRRTHSRASLWACRCATAVLPWTSRAFLVCRSLLSYHGCYLRGAELCYIPCTAKYSFALHGNFHQSHACVLEGSQNATGLTMVCGGRGCQRWLGMSSGTSKR